MYKLLFEDVVQKIEDLIYRGIYKEGDKLPPERKLAEEYGVSRNVIREAIGTLREKGYVIVKPGKGTYITNLNNIEVTETLKRIIRNDNMVGEEILEVREGLELMIIRKAVQKSTAQDIEDLKKIYEKMDEKRYFDREYAEADAQFHITLAKATQNSIFPLLVQSFFDMLEGSIFTMTRLSPYSVDTTQQHHRMLIQAIEDRDEKLAISTIKSHMSLIDHDIKMLKKRELL